MYEERALTERRETDLQAPRRRSRKEKPKNLSCLCSNLRQLIILTTIQCSIRRPSLARWLGIDSSFSIVDSAQRMISAVRPFLHLRLLPASSLHSTPPPLRPLLQLPRTLAFHPAVVNPRFGFNQSKLRFGTMSSQESASKRVKVDGQGECHSKSVRWRQ